ncbi:MAG: hypothetical protein CME31_15150, partial [Gimesia sp.]|nr:hypothetical protein [Gimesia sp.]
MRIRSRIFSALTLSVITLFLNLAVQSPATAQSSVSPMMKLLKSGRVPASRQGTIIELICRKGNPEELGFIWEQIVNDKFQGEVKEKSLIALKEAFQTRKIKPTGSLADISKLIDAKPPVNQIAIELAGLWKVSGAAAKLQELALSAKTDEKLRLAAIDALVSIGGPESIKAMQKLTQE